MSKIGLPPRQSLNTRKQSNKGRASMRRSRLAIIVVVLALVVLNSRVSRTAQELNPERTKPADVDGARITGADQEPGNWMSHGRDYGEQRCSPLKEVNDENI